MIICSVTIIREIIQVILSLTKIYCRRLCCKHSQNSRPVQHRPHFSKKINIWPGREKFCSANWRELIFWRRQTWCRPSQACNWKLILDRISTKDSIIRFHWNMTIMDPVLWGSPSLPVRLPYLSWLTIKKIILYLFHQMSAAFLGKHQREVKT